jgi:hypothetical protein
MGSTISYIAPKGALLNGSRWARFTNGTTATQWFEFATIKLAVSGLIVVVFRSNQDAVNWKLANPALLDNLSYDKDWVSDVTNLDTLLKTLQPSAATLIANGLAYDTTVVAPNATDETGFYSDGTGNFANTAYKDQTTADILAAALADSSTTTDTSSQAWYAKPITWVIVGVATIGGYLVLKKS